jgi:superfamily II helicase
MKESKIMFGKNDNDEKPIIQSSGYKDGKLYRICPHCGQEKPLDDFGLRNMGNDKIRNQSWCKDCRVSTK